MSSERWNSPVLEALKPEKDNLSVENIFPKGELLDLKVKETARPVVILVEGLIDPSKIVLEPSMDGIKHTPELDEHINAIWKKTEEDYQIAHPGEECPNNLKVLVKGIEIDRGNVTIRTGVTDYKERKATIKPEYRIVQRFGLESVAIQLATSSIILTVDNKICLAQLGKKTEEKNRIGGIHTIAGLLEMKADKTPVSPAENIFKEISEELGFGIEEAQKRFTPETVLAIEQDPKIFATDIIFLVKTDVTEQEIKAKRGRSDKEVTPVFVDDTAEGIRGALLVFAKTGTATALSGLYLYGKMRFGNKWADSIRQRLVRRFTVWDKLDSYDPGVSEKMRVKTADRLARLHS